MKKEKIINEIKEWAVAIAIGVVVFLVVNTFISIGVIDGRSMESTYTDGQYVITLKRGYALNYSDVIAFTYHDDTTGDEFHIKRIVGMPGDEVVVDEDDVYLNGDILVENTGAYYEHAAYQLQDGEYFVLGDNYPISKDSRADGPVESKEILGKIITGTEQKPHPTIN